ncbi:hypothetical protein RIR_jg16462.t1 [Rhizophagus irregularis DAOM 181602=DAOM 197198]|nr:hypothetical protein RIR_jg16462.t1 [Rhizophagus irregularis DAOM 181602=DAOM 197198]
MSDILKIQLFSNNIIHWDVGTDTLTGLGVAVPLGIDPLLSLIWCTYNRYDSCNYLKRVLSLVWDHVVEFVNYYDNGCMCGYYNVIFDSSKISNRIDSHMSIDRYTKLNAI